MEAVSETGWEACPTAKLLAAIWLRRLGATFVYFLRFHPREKQPPGG